MRVGKFYALFGRLLLALPNAELPTSYRFIISFHERHRRKRADRFQQGGLFLGWPF